MIWLSLSLFLAACNSAVDTHWSEREKQILRSLLLDENIKVPQSMSNRFADNEQAAKFGEALFFDKALSRDGRFSCASCHDPDRYFVDGLPTGVGQAKTGRNTPTVVGSAFQEWFYWDGRRDSLWSQALIPIEAADEMGGSRLAAVRHIGSNDDYKKQYEQIFGAYPKVLLKAGLPEHAGPLGEGLIKEQWYRLPLPVRRSINRVYANIGKAIAAYERRVLPQPGRFDRYAASVLNGKSQSSASMSPVEIAGLKLFLDEGKTQCLQCHNGPMFSNGAFHNIASGTFRGENIDYGRMFGLQAVLMDEFNCLGIYSDSEPEQCTQLRFLNKNAHGLEAGAFKTPSLRGVKYTSPYFHDGRFEALQDVVQHYVDVSAEGSRGVDHELARLELSEKEISQLVAFMKTLDDDRYE